MLRQQNTSKKIYLGKKHLKGIKNQAKQEMLKVVKLLPLNKSFKYPNANKR